MNNFRMSKTVFHNNVHGGAMSRLVHRTLMFGFMVAALLLFPNLSFAQSTFVPPDPNAATPGTGYEWAGTADRDASNRLCREFRPVGGGAVQEACKNIDSTITIYSAVANDGSIPFSRYQSDGTLLQSGTQEGTGGGVTTDAATGQTSNYEGPGGGPKGEETCDSIFTTPTNCLVSGIKNSVAFVIGGVAYAMLILAGFMLWLVGGLFNWVVIRTVFEYGSYFGASEGLLLAWSIMRDIGNIVLLFGFIFMGVSMIINNRNEFSSGRSLANLILFAVLLNFSLFATQLVIDVSNSMASVFTAQAGYTSCAGNTANAADCANDGISGSVLRLAGMASIWDTVDIKDFASFMANPTQQAPVYLGLAIFVTITAVVLLAAAIMLLIRAVVLMFLMITSPIGFAGMAIPPLQKIAHDWWRTLISQAFFAPAYLLLVLISIKMAQGLTGGLLGGGSGTSLQAALINGEAAGPQTIMLFAIVIGFMLASLIIAKRMGAYGASMATNSASSFVFGGVARGTNAMVGGGAYAARRFQQRTGIGGTAGKVAVNRFVRPLERANLDIRRAGIGAALSAAGVTAGAKPAEHATFGELKHGYEDFKAGKEGKALERQYQSEVGKDTLEEEAHHITAGVSLSPESQKLLAGMNEKELAALHGIQTGVEGLAKSLSPEQFEGLMKSDALSEQQKENLRDARFAEIAALVEAAHANPGNAAVQDAARDAVQKISDKDVAQVAQSQAHSSLLSDATFAGMLTDDQADKAKGNQRILQAQRDGLQAARQSRFTSTASATATLATMNADTFAKLSGSTVAKPEVYTAASGKQLAAVDPNKLTDAQEQALITHLSAEKAAGSRKWAEFDARVRANPTHKWHAVPIP